MKVIYKRELEMQDGTMARFTLGKEYIYHAVTDTHGAYIENDRGDQHFMSEDFMRQYFAEVVTTKRMTIDAAHRLVAYDAEIGALQAELENLRELIAQRMEEYQALKDEYGVEE